MGVGVQSQTFGEGVLNELISVLIFNHLKFDLLVETWHEVSAHRILLAIAQQTHVLKCVQSVALEELQELFRYCASYCLFVVLVSQDLVHTLLQVSSVNFVVTASLASLNSLCLHEHGLSILLVTSIMLSQYCVFMLLNDFNPSLLETLADEHLKDRLSLKVKIEEIWVDILHLNCLIIALFIRNISRTWWSINVIIRFNLRLINHIVTIVQFNPIMHRLHHLLLLLLLVDLSHLLLLLLLRVCLVIAGAAIFTTIHLLHLLLLFLLLSNKKLFHIAVTGKWPSNQKMAS